MNRSRSFAALFDKLSRIERQSRPKYKSAFPDWFIRRTLHVPNLIIRLGTCKVRHLSGPYVPSPFSFLFPSSSTILLVSLLNFSYSLLHNFIISPPSMFLFPPPAQFYYFTLSFLNSLLLHNFNLSNLLLILEFPLPQFYNFPPSFFFIFFPLQNFYYFPSLIMISRLLHNFIIFPPPPPPPYLFYIFSIHKYIDLILTLHRP